MDQRHAVAWALRQPWIADRERGPTFNASVNGLAYLLSIQDGPTFIGILPLPGATDLGRDVEVVLLDEGELTEMHRLQRTGLVRIPCNSRQFLLASTP